MYKYFVRETTYLLGKVVCAWNMSVRYRQCHVVFGERRRLKQMSLVPCSSPTNLTFAVELLNTSVIKGETESPERNNVNIPRWE